MASDTQKMIGRRIRRIRTQKAWTLDQFSKATEIDRTTLSRVERGTQNTRFDHFETIAEKLGIDITALVSPKADKNDDYVVRYFESGDWLNQVIKKHNKTYSKDLSLVLNSGASISTTFKVAKDEKKELEFARHIAGSEEIIMVLSGQVDIFLADNSTPIVLKQHDSIVYVSDVKHSIRNPYDEEALCFGVTVNSGYNSPEGLIENE